MLSDFDLPDLDGLSLISRFRSSLPASGLVLYTAAWSESLERRARLNGADDCLDKTVPPSELVVALRNSVVSRRSKVVA